MTHYRPITVPGMAEPIGIADQPSPMMDWVEIARMVIDEQYQRPINHGGWATIRKIAANFRWSCFTPVLLAPIEGGLFAVIDGQHRVHAAMLCGIKSVPAMMIPIAATEQAQAFIQVNTARTRVSQYNLFKAGLQAGEQWALEADRAVSSAGCKLMRFAPSAKSKKPGDVVSVALIRALVTGGHAKAVTTTLTALRRIEDTVGEHTRITLYSDWVLSPLMRAVAEFPGLTADALEAILRRHRVFNVIERAEKIAKEERRAACTVVRQAFAAIIRVSEAIDAVEVLE